MMKMTEMSERTMTVLEHKTELRATFSKIEGSSKVHIW